jgi:hypothetical protein
MPLAARRCGKLFAIGDLFADQVSALGQATSVGLQQKIINAQGTLKRIEPDPARIALVGTRRAEAAD